MKVFIQNCRTHCAPFNKRYRYYSYLVILFCRGEVFLDSCVVIIADTETPNYPWHLATMYPRTWPVHVNWVHNWNVLDDDCCCCCRLWCSCCLLMYDLSSLRSVSLNYCRRKTSKIFLLLKFIASLLLLLLIPSSRGLYRRLRVWVLWVCPPASSCGWWFMVSLSRLGFILPMSQSQAIDLQQRSHIVIWVSSLSSGSPD